MLFSWSLIQFDGGRLDGYGERPEHGDPAKDWIVYGSAILAIPVVWFLFTNLMNYQAPAEGSGIIGYIASLPHHGQAVVRHLPSRRSRHPRLVLFQG